MRILELPTTRGTPFTCRLVETGDAYGFDDCLTNDGDPMVEFYDARYKFTKYGQFVSRYYAKYGQFVSRYYVKTLQKSKTCRAEGLCLDGGVPEWSVEAARMKIVLDWLDDLYPEPWPEAFV